MGRCFETTRQILITSVILDIHVAPSGGRIFHWSWEISLPLASPWGWHVGLSEISWLLLCGLSLNNDSSGHYCNLSSILVYNQMPACQSQVGVCHLLSILQWFVLLLLLTSVFSVLYTVDKMLLRLNIQDPLLSATVGVLSCSTISQFLNELDKDFINPLKKKKDQCLFAEIIGEMLRQIMVARRLSDHFRHLL